MNKEFSFEITEQITELGASKTGWTKELNKVAYNGGAAKFDIREWAPDHEKMGKGVTLTDDEAKALYEALKGYFEN